MSALEEIRNERIKKLNILKEKGIDPYPVTTERTHTITEVISDFETIEKEKREVVLGGRVMIVRGQGAILFADFNDGTGRFQAVFKEDEMNNENFDLFVDTVDGGDFIEVSGTLFTTQKGQQSILVKEWRMLAKSLLPLPDKHHGLKDEDERYRKRYLDILTNEEVRDVVRKRSVFWNAFRSFLLERGYLEVETPILENTTGGAEARPFVTHHNALDIDVYLRISAGELWQKRLMVAGIPKVFEIGRIFRNEGMSYEHLQDYTQIEFYEAYSDFKKGMDMVRDLYRYVAEKTFGTLSFTIRDFEVDLSKEWEMYDFSQIILEKYGIDPREVSEEEAIATLDKENIQYEKKNINLERAIDTLWKTCRKGIAGPGFLINMPVYLEPLAKKSPEDPRVVERFQVILAGSEVGKGFSELNDPIDQRERFEHQARLREAGDEEAQMNDEEYVEALEHGMPPTFGFGISERLFSFLQNVSIREGQIFPLMRPRE